MEPEPDTETPTATNLPQPDTPKAYLQALMAHLTCFNTWGYIASYGVFESHYSTTFPHLPATTLAWIGSLQIFLIFFVGTFSGRALDAGYFYHVYFLGAGLQVLGVLATSVAEGGYWELVLTQGVCTGLGSGLMFCPVMGLVATWFVRYRVLALAFCLVGSGTGGMVFPAMVKTLLPVLGFGWTVRVVGFVMLGLTMLTCVFLRVRLPSRKGGGLVEWEAFREPAYVLFCLGMFFNFWALYFAFFYIGSFGREEIGLSYGEAVNLIIVNNGIGILGRLIPAYLANKYFGPLNVLIPLTLGAALLMYCWIAVDSVAGAYTFVILYGIFSNGVQGLWPSTLSSLTTDITKTGVRMGMGFTIVSLGCLTGPPLGGALIGLGYGYLPAQIWGGTSFVAGAVCLVGARYYNRM